MTLRTVPIPVELLEFLKDVSKPPSTSSSSQPCLSGFTINEKLEVVNSTGVTLKRYIKLSGTTIAYDSLDLTTTAWTKIPNHPNHSIRLGRVRQDEALYYVPIWSQGKSGSNRYHFDHEHLAEILLGRTRDCEDEVNQLALAFPDLCPYLNRVFDTAPHARKNLLVIADPLFINEWNDNLDLLMTISRGSKLEVSWLCKKHGIEFRAIVDSRTRQQKGCSVCLMSHNERSKLSHCAIQTGACTEEFFVDAFNQRDEIDGAKWTGQLSNSKDDLCVTYQGNIYALQSKTASESAKSPGNFTVNMGEYPPNMLICVTDVKRRFFMIAMSRDLPQIQFGVTFTSRSRSHNQHKFYNLQDALDRAIELLPSSLLLEDLEDRYSVWNLQEKESLDRFEKFCEERGFVVTDPPNNGTPIDKYVNGFSVQHKSSSCLSSSGSTYQISLDRCTGGGNRGPYSDKDGIDFFVIEVVLNPGHFAIIPVAEFIASGHIATDSQPGKTAASIYSHDSVKANRRSKFWDAGHLLQLRN